METLSRGDTDSDDCSAVFFLEFTEAAPVYDARDHVPHVECLSEVSANNTMQLVRGIYWIL